MVDWKNGEFVRKSEFEQAVAAVEMFFPRFKGKLLWSKAVIAGRSVTHLI